MGEAHPIRPAETDLHRSAREALIAALLTWSGRSEAELGLTEQPESIAPGRPPRPEMGDLGISCFALAKRLRRPPVEIAASLVAPVEAEWSRRAESGELPALERAVALGPYLNLVLDGGSLAAWVTGRIGAGAPPFGAPLPPTGRRILVEYSAPNTNKPLHLGHVRNNLLGASLCQILAAAGEEVIPVNLVNDRGIHIAKSMVAYRRWGEGATPESAGRKGDHFVGEFYVRFGRELAAEADTLARARGTDPAALDEEARRALEEETELMRETRDCLRRWEEGEAGTLDLWRRMNGWVYAGFDQTYARLGCAFRKWYFESETYRLGKDIVLDGLARGVFRRADDGSVWAPFGEGEGAGLKDKLLLRSDGTSVYITQDLGTTVRKFEDFRMDQAIFVVASEQTHHFRLLFELLARLGYAFADRCHHLAYGLIELPHGLGKLKSREGRAVDADDLLDELSALARSKAVEGGYVTEEAVDLDALADAIGQGALKLYLLQVGAEKNIVFDPDATLAFEGDTGPAVQYSHARICSIARRALAEGSVMAEDFVAIGAPDPFAGFGTGSPAAAGGSAAGGACREVAEPSTARFVRTAAGLRPESVEAQRLTAPEEKALALELARFPSILAAAAAQLNPAPLAGYLLDLTKAYARFYHHCPVLRAESPALMRARLHLCLAVASTLRRGLALLGIQAPDAM